MKAKELAEVLLKNPEFDVKLVINDDCYNNGIGKYFTNYRTFNIDDVADVGYSSKIILLSGDEE